MHRLQTVCMVALFLMAASFTPTAAAQSFPSKPVRIVLAYASGGPAEFVARTVGEKAAARLGQPVLIEARPGANERVATEHVLRSPADGYSMLLCALTHSINPSLFEMSYDAQKEMTGLIHLTDIVPMVTAHPDSPFRNIGDRKSTRLNSSHSAKSRMPSSA